MPRLFTVANDESLISMINSATTRLLVVAPGLSTKVAAALAARVTGDHCPSELSITLDVDPEVCRLGYGDIGALETLTSALNSHGLALQTQKGVRVGLVVADADILVFSPTPELIEAGSNSEEKPNAIRISNVSPEGLAFACGAKDSSIPGLTQEVGLHPADTPLVEKVQANLKENPPRKFNLARLERVFNYRLEFVEFSLEGLKLATKTVPLPADLLGLVEPDLQERLRNTFRVFEAGVPFEFEILDPDDPQRKLKVTEKWLGNEAKKIRDDFFISLGSSSYGNLILKRRKDDFMKKVASLSSLVDIYAEKVKVSISARVQSTRDQLIETLFRRVKAAPPLGWLAQSVDGRLEDEDVRERLTVEVDKAFGKMQETFAPVVTCLFKGVQYETITADSHFRERIEKYFGTKDAARLLSEYDASRAEELIGK